MDNELRKSGRAMLKALGHVLALVTLFYLADLIAGALSLDGALVTPIIYAVIAFLYYSALQIFIRQN
jgi:hypothetical protein